MPHQKILDVIRTLRRKNQLSQEDLAQQVDLSFRSYQRIESGETSPRFEDLLRILRVLSPDLSRSLIEALLFVPLDDVERTKISLSSRSCPPLKHSASSMVEGIDAIQKVKKAMRHDLLTSSGLAGSWEFNAPTALLYWSPEMFAIYGLDPKQAFDQRAFSEKFSPTDLRKIDDDLLNVVQRGHPFENVHRVFGADKPYLARAFARRLKTEAGLAFVVGMAERIS